MECLLGSEKAAHMITAIVVLLSLILTCCIIIAIAISDNASAIGMVGAEHSRKLGEIVDKLGNISVHLDQLMYRDERDGY